jgi:hypothetical protein
MRDMDEAQALRVKLYPEKPRLGQVLLERSLAVGSVALAVWLYHAWVGH